MDQKIVTQPERKDSLGKTFVRGVIGGIGWVVGLIIAWAFLIFITIQLVNRFELNSKIEKYIQDFLLQTTEKQLLNQQKMIQDLVPTELNIKTDLPTDFYPEDIQNLLQQNKNK